MSRTGGSRVSAQSATASSFSLLVITFGVSGLWHGAKWTFIVWGLLNALYYVPLVLLNRHRQHVAPIAPGRLLPGIGDLARMTSTFLLTMVAWVFFRADSLGQAFSYLAAMGTSFGGEKVLGDLTVGWRWTVYLVVSVLIARRPC